MQTPQSFDDPYQPAGSASSRGLGHPAAMFPAEAGSNGSGGDLSGLRFQTNGTARVDGAAILARFHFVKKVLSELQTPADALGLGLSGAQVAEPKGRHDSIFKIDILEDGRAVNQLSIVVSDHEVKRSPQEIPRHAFQALCRIIETYKEQARLRQQRAKAAAGLLNDYFI